jgi:chromosomal replication initiator protein
MSVDEIWGKALEVLERKLNRPAFEMLIRRIAPITIDENVFFMSIPRNTQLDVLREYQGVIEETLSAITNSEIKINAMHDETEQAPAPQPQIPIPVPEQKADTAPSKKTAPFLNPRYTFDLFVVGSNNQMANNAALAAAEAPGRAYNPLFLFGGSGLGKTHLLQAIGHYIAATKPNLIVEYITTDAFTNEYLNCIRENRLHEFKNHFLKLDVLLIDDIHFFERKVGTMYEFFHIFNDFYEKKKQIVITSDRLPKDIPTMEDRLVSRLNWGLVCDIQQPDIETRISILKKRCEVGNYHISDEIIVYIATAITANIRNLEGALTRVEAYAKFKKQELTIELAQSIISGIEPERSPESVTVAGIISEVSKHFGIDPSDIMGQRRKKEFVLARSVAMYLAKGLTKLTLSAIGSEFGGRDHTTVLYSYEKIGKEIVNDPNFGKVIEGLKQKIKG